MNPVFSLPMLPIQAAPVIASLPAQAVNFDALLTESSAKTPDTPVTSVKPIISPPAAQGKEGAIVTVPETDIDTAIRPLLAAYADDPTPVSISAVSPETAKDGASVPDVESDEAQPDQPECTDMVVPIPIVIPAPIHLPAIVIASVAPAMLPTDTAAAKANPAPKATSKAGAPLMEPEVKISARANTESLLTIGTRQNNAGTISVADLAGLLGSTSVESNPVSGAGFPMIMADRIAEATVRPLTDASALVADRALDVARGSLWLDQLAGDIAAVQDHDRDLSFRLIPAQLGQLDVKIANSDNGMQLNFNTQTEAAAQIISNTQSRLVEELKAQGVRVAGSEVNAGSGQQSFAQQNSQTARAAAITEFERPSFQSPEPTPPNEPPNGRFA